MNQSINCIVVDDEALARQGLQEYIEEIDFLNLIGTAENPIEANEIISQKQIDLMFLDIQMPKITGIDFLKLNKNLPKTILTTAYSEYALESFELNVLDYLLKPISFERFLKACEKAKEVIFQNSIAAHYFYVKSEKKYEKIIFDDILFIESLQNYIIIHTHYKKIITYLSLKDIEGYLQNKPFIQVHKSYIVALNKIDNLTKEELYIQQYQVPIGRTYTDHLFSKIITSNLLKK